MDFQNVWQCPLIGLFTRTGLIAVSQPAVVAATRNFQHLAHLSDAMFISPGSNERILHFVAGVNKPNAFFRISCSRRSRAFSRFNASSSSSRGRPWPGKACSPGRTARFAARHRYRYSTEMPKSRAMAVASRPLSSASRTALSLNSRVYFCRCLVVVMVPSQGCAPTGARSLTGCPSTARGGA